MNGNAALSDRTLALIAVTVLAIATFLPSLLNGFVYDDVEIVVQQTHLHSLENLKQIVTSPWWTNDLYRPFTKLTFAVDWFISGGDAWYFHFINVLLHVVTTICVWGLANRWLGLRGATVAAALFAVHPVHVEAVASVVGRAEILATLFAVLSCLLYRWDGVLSYYHDQTWRRLASSFGTIITLFLALASKESAFVTPGLFLLIDWMESRIRQDSFEARFRAHWVIWLGCVALALEWLWIRSIVLGDIAGDAPAPGLEGAGILGRVFAMAPVVLQYLRLLVLPVHLSADYSPDFIPVQTTLTLLGVAGLSVVVVCIAVAFRTRIRLPIATFALAWLGGAILIISNVILPTGVLLAERTLYLPSVGFVLLVAGAATALPPSRGRVTDVALSLIILLGLARSAFRVPVFQSDETFFPRLIADAPGSFRGVWLQGQMSYMEDQRSEGERYFRAALAIHPLFPNVWSDFGRRLQEEERWAEAATSFSVAFRLDSNRVYDAANAVSNFLRAGLSDSARTYAERAAQSDPDHPRVKGALGEIAAADGRLLEAMTLHRQAAWLDPDEPIYWYRAARAAFAANYCPAALRAVRAIAQLDEDFSSLPELRRQLTESGCTAA